MPDDVKSTDPVLLHSCRKGHQNQNLNMMRFLPRLWQWQRQLLSPFLQIILHMVKWSNKRKRQKQWDSYSVSTAGLHHASQGREEGGGHCSLALFSGGGLLGGAGADDLVAGSLSSCFTASVGGSGSFFTSTATQEHDVREIPVDVVKLGYY